MALNLAAKQRCFSPSSRGGPLHRETHYFTSLLSLSAGKRNGTNAQTPPSTQPFN